MNRLTGEHIKAIRERAGLTQPEFAVQVGMLPNGSVISEIENGKRPVSKRLDFQVRRVFLQDNHN